MDVLDGYPLVRAFLGGLCGWELEQLAFPFELRWRMYRGRLQAPFRILPHLGAEGAEGEPENLQRLTHLRVLNRTNHMLDAFYPGLVRALNADEQLKDLHAKVSEHPGYRIAGARQWGNSRGPMSKDERQLMDTAMAWDWRPHDTAALLYQFSLSDEFFPYVLPLLEGALRVAPQVGRALHELAGFSVAEARAMTLVQAAARTDAAALSAVGAGQS
jgi:hypothetical protein